MKQSRLIALLLAVMMMAGILSACGGSASYADGDYEAQSAIYEADEEDDGGDGYGVVKLTIKDNTITACEFTTYMPDGTLKDADYGKEGGVVANQDYYNKAQRAVAACSNYAEQLVAKGELSAVDCISGATISYGEFQEAVKLALKDAKQ